MKRIYIAGPMTGMPDLNYPAFFEAAETLTKLGYVPLNPARKEGRENCKTWRDFMRASLLDIAVADGLAMLPGWAESRGAVIEYNLAHELGLDVRSLEEWM